MPVGPAGLAWRVPLVACVQATAVVMAATVVVVATAVVAATAAAAAAGSGIRWNTRQNGGRR